MRGTAQRGLTLIEVMVATVVLLVAALGMLGLHATGVRLEGQAREITRATTIAQDLLAQVQLWEYDDPRLANASPANDLDFADTAAAFEAEGSPPTFDHAEADLSSAAYEWNGLPAAALVGGRFERYWNVAELDDANANGNFDGRRVAVIVRWPRGSGWHRVVLVGFKVNPQDRL